MASSSMAYLRACTAALLLTLLLGARPASAQEPAPQISLVTFGPGQTYWERFGHDAILVGDPADPQAQLYNYGMFDFRQKNFFLNFARGRMNYRIDVEPFYAALRLYAGERRWVYLQQLDLEPAQRRELAAFLRWNVHPENAEYRYDYFIANCATRVRDALDRASGGAIALASKNVPTERSYRDEATRLIAPVAPLALLMDLAMGPRSDAPIDRWQQSFVPMVLKDVVQDATLTQADGTTRPLVARAAWVLRSDAWPEPARPPHWLPLLAAIGLGLAAMLMLLDRRRDLHIARWTFAVLASGIGIALTLGGLVLLAVWAFTDHWSMWSNRNLLLLNPLLLLLLPCWLCAGRAGWQPRVWQRRLAGLIVAAGVLAIPLLALPGAQHNAPWIAAVLPVLAALAWSTRRRRDTA